jgi:uncharacterized protein (TIGR00661 family)
MQKHFSQSGSVMLAVQGEGRGHLTQAMAVYDMLLAQGIEVCCVVVGTSAQRALPAFFKDHFRVPVVPLMSPNFVKDRHQKSVRIGASVWKNTLNLNGFLKSLKIIRRLVRFHQPTTVINFYEPLMGIYRTCWGGEFKMISIAHQYVYLHPSFRFPYGKRWEHWMLTLYTKLTSVGSNLILAISMYELPELSQGQLKTIPPILRPAVFQAIPKRGNFILVYILNEGYMSEIIAWHCLHPEVVLHCFTDSKTVREVHDGQWQWDEKLCFHSLNDQKFLEMLASCDAVATTAGFETVCETYYLGKPILMVPVEGHMEQQCNARDASKFGAGDFAQHFQLEKLFNTSAVDNAVYRAWVERSSKIVMTYIRGMLIGEIGLDDAGQAPVIPMDTKQTEVRASL